MINKIGFMQGRLSEIVNGKIQAFPHCVWESEFYAAAQIDLNLMEWTIDQNRLYENPLMTVNGRKKISDLCQRYQISIPSLTGDCFMQAPFWKVGSNDRAKLQADFIEVCRACSSLGIRMIVVPLVDNGRLDTLEQENILVKFLLDQKFFFAENSLKIIFESDFNPNELQRFIMGFPEEHFGINYDIGNSAALGFNPSDEFAAYGCRVINVHVKDRILGGTTVELTTGNADFEAVFKEIAKQGYHGNFILQTARAIDGNHSKVLNDYRDLTKQWLEQAQLARTNWDSHN